MAFSLTSKFLIAAVATATLLGTAAISKATTVSYNTAVTTQINPGNFSPALTEFDPSLGTLTAATINFTLTLHPAETEVNPFGPAGTSFTVTLNNLSFNLLDPYGANSPESYDFTGNAAYSASGTTAAPSFTFNQIFPAPDVSYTGGSGVPTSHLGDYIGTSTVSPTFTDSSSAGTSISGASFVGYALSFDGTETVTYTYTPTPEPASLSLLALSGAGLLFRRRRQL